MSPRDHNHFQDLLEQHISGAALAPDDRLSLFDHIETCDACRRILEAEERITARMKTVPRLVAPSDLRSKILGQAVRDHRERNTTPSEDPEIADLLKARPRTDLHGPARTHTDPHGPTRTSKDPHSSSSHPSQRRAQHTDAPASDELPVFAGITIPRPSRLRRAWRRASPVLATGFLIIAAAGALYTGQFQGIPLAGEAQQFVWNIIDPALNKDDPYDSPSGPQKWQGHPAREPVIAGLQPSGNPVSTLETDKNVRPASVMAAGLHDPSLAGGLPGANALSADVHGLEARATPLPGTRAVAGLIKDTRSWFGSVDSTVAAIARASEQTIPAPAEKATPQIAALVLKPTDTDDTPGGFQPSELAAALKALADAQPGGRVARQDQFAMNGHRYRLYTLELPAGCCNRMVETLTPYQTPADSVIVNALASQNQVNTSRNQTIQFYSSNESHLRSALETITPISNKGKSERIRVVVVE